MTLSVEDIYRSENGDVWQLVENAASGRLDIRHVANLSSGGHVTEMPIEDFLSRCGSGPEYAAARRLLETRRSSLRVG